jgi:preprotein translocase subunit SecB
MSEEKAQSVISQFQFVNYKITSLTLEVKPFVSLIESGIFLDDWKFSFEISHPSFFQEKKLYSGGIALNLTYPIKLADGSEDEGLRVHGRILGLFRVDQKFDNPKIEHNLIYNQIPAILLPYLRAAISSLLANAGYGSTILPLINIYAQSQQLLKDVELTVLP